MKTFKCQSCGKNRPVEDRRSYSIDGYTMGSCKTCEEGHSSAMAHHAASGAAWMADFGDRPVINYDTGEKIADTAKEYMKRKKD